MKNKGFTLVELLAVITLIGLIALVTVAAVSKSLGKSKETIANNQVEQIENAARLWMADHQMLKPNDSNSSEICNYAEINSCPKDYKTLVITLGDLQSEGYLDNNVKDLKTKDTLPADTKIKIVLDGKKIIYKINIGTACAYEEGETFDFVYNGKTQTFTTECEGNYKLEVWGAQGGTVNTSLGQGGKGGYSVGNTHFTNDITLYVYVGQQPTSRTGGWNGGSNGDGSSTSTSTTSSGQGQGYGGGGGTDISLQGTANSTTWNETNHLYSRIIVAGGGGGSTNYASNEVYGGFNYSRGTGGAGGGTFGEPCPYAISRYSNWRTSTSYINGTACGTSWGRMGGPGGQTSGGYQSSYSSGYGSFGYGKDAYASPSNGGGGAGGGWYGGAGSTDGDSDLDYFGGPGGSGYVYTSSTASYYPSGCLLNSSYYLTNAETIAGNTSFPSPTGGNETGHEGNGFARITYLGE